MNDAPWIIEALHRQWGWTQYAWASGQKTAMILLQDMAILIRRGEAAVVQGVNARTGEVLLLPEVREALKRA